MKWFQRGFLSVLWAGALCSLGASGRAEGVSAWSAEVTGDASFLGTGSVEHHRDHFSGLSEIQSSVGLVLTRQLSETLQLRIGGEYQIYSFDTKTPTPIPDVVQGVNLVVGTNFNIGQAILARIDAKPGFYGEFEHLSWKTFNVPFDVGGSYFVSSDLQLILGFEVNLDRSIWLFPTAGVRWQISDRCLLNAVLPRPQLEYTFFEKALTFHIGGDLGGSTFRMNNEFGKDRGNPKLNNAILDYSEVRTGAGFRWRVSKIFTIDLEGGCVPYRSLDYTRANYKLVSEEVVPYVRIAIETEF